MTVIEELLAYDIQFESETWGILKYAPDDDVIRFIKQMVQKDELIVAMDKFASHFPDYISFNARKNGLAGYCLGVMILRLTGSNWSDDDAAARAEKLAEKLLKYYCLPENYMPIGNIMGRILGLRDMQLKLIKEFTESAKCRHPKFAWNKQCDMTLDEMADRAGTDPNQPRDVQKITDAVVYSGLPVDSLASQLIAEESEEGSV